jgi:cytochrome c oxidase assembly protein subunit 11
VVTYVAMAAVGMLGASYVAVPLYRLYCQNTGLGGSAVAGHSSDQIENRVPVKDRSVKSPLMSVSSGSSDLNEQRSMWYQ